MAKSTNGFIIKNVITSDYKSDSERVLINKQNMVLIYAKKIPLDSEQKINY